MSRATKPHNRLTFTAASHDLVMMVEVMGREAGHLALHSGIAGGAVPISQVCDLSPLAVDPDSDLVQTARALGIDSFGQEA